ncbi:PREDICTED: ribosome biogenesis regulatory protein homolog [Priapulus caudatus]|uniref:Ribosome biogenesis regulatory protein n=1 Tax=Priapulus caudatus TaxID=37621 RepID=A0ABM1EJV8_PRICU|nr:PREDICTED: ribosome biogenesis regulatory protein homolog [Priapulus caudatus]
MDFVSDVLQRNAEKETKYKTTAVEKDIDVELDIGNLLSSDGNPLDHDKFRSNQDECMRTLARDNIQLLVNKIWEVPVERIENVVVAKLPPPTTVIPREKRIPKPKPASKWQEYARAKGVQNKKKGRMVWDEQTKSYKPRWGYDRAKDDTKDWLIEVPANADPNEDMFSKRVEAKKERVAKNEMQRLKNIARAQKIKVPGVGLTPTSAPTKPQVARALTAAKFSTPSLGKFSEKIPKEAKHIKVSHRRKFDPVTGNMDTEKKRQMEIFNKLNSRRPALDVTKAANKACARGRNGKEDCGRQKEEDCCGERKLKEERSQQPQKGSNAPVKRKGQEGERNLMGPVTAWSLTCAVLLTVVY